MEGWTRSSGAASSRAPRKPPEPAPDGAPAPSLTRRLAAEWLGTAFLLVAVVGSGIMGERLAGGNAAVALLANALATAGALAVLILVLGPISGAHFNPVVSLAMAWRRELRWRHVPAYLLAQLAGAMTGVAAAHGMFELPLFSISTHPRAGPAQALGEIVATFGLVVAILGCARHRPAALPGAVACYVGAAYWFTASTAFANPAVTLARALTDSFAGIRPVDVPSFVAAQLLGAAMATMIFGWLWGDRDRVIVPNKR